MRLFLKEKYFFQKFQFFSKKNVLRFLSLRYGADFRRSRLVSFWSDHSCRVTSCSHYVDIHMSAQPNSSGVTVIDSAESPLTPQPFFTFTVLRFGETKSAL